MWRLMWAIKPSSFFISAAAVVGGWNLGMRLLREGPSREQEGLACSIFALLVGWIVSSKLGDVAERAQERRDFRSDILAFLDGFLDFDDLFERWRGRLPERRRKTVQAAHLSPAADNAALLNPSSCGTVVPNVTITPADKAWCASLMPGTWLRRLDSGRLGRYIEPVRSPFYSCAFMVESDGIEIWFASDVSCAHPVPGEWWERVECASCRKPPFPPLRIRENHPEWAPLVQCGCLRPVRLAPDFVPVK